MHEGAYVTLVRDGVDSVDFEVGGVVLLRDAVEGDYAPLEVVLEDAVGVPHLLVGERRRGEQIGLKARIYRASAVIHLNGRYLIKMQLGSLDIDFATHQVEERLKGWQEVEVVVQRVLRNRGSRLLLRD